MERAGYACIDWDDTLAENLAYFRRVEAELCVEIAGETGFSPEEIKRRGEEIDVAVARRMGLVTDSFGTAWVECYREFCTRAGVPADPGREEAIRRACLYPYTVRQELDPWAKWLLSWLKGSGFEVTVWTAGAPEVQERKIEESGLAPWIDRRVIVPVKDPDALRRALGSRDRSRAFVLGNSLRSDIAPALALGIPALHVRRGAWAYDEAPIDTADPRYIPLDGLEEAPRALAALFPWALPPPSLRLSGEGKGA